VPPNHLLDHRLIPLASPVVVHVRGDGLLRGVLKQRHVGRGPLGFKLEGSDKGWDASACSEELRLDVFFWEGLRLFKEVGVSRVLELSQKQGCIRSFLHLI